MQTGKIKISKCRQIKNIIVNSKIKHYDKYCFLTIKIPISISILLMPRLVQLDIIIIKKFPFSREP